MYSTAGLISQKQQKRVFGRLMMTLPNKRNEFLPKKINDKDTKLQKTLGLYKTMKKK